MNKLPKTLFNDKLFLKYAIMNLSKMPTKSTLDVLNFVRALLDNFELATTDDKWSPYMNKLFETQYYNYKSKSNLKVWRPGGSASRTKKNRMIYLRKNNSRSRVYLTRNASAKFKRIKYSIKNKISGGGFTDLQKIIISTISEIRKRVNTDVNIVNECNADSTKCNKINYQRVQTLTSMFINGVKVTNTALTKAGVFGQQVTYYMSYFSSPPVGVGTTTFGTTILAGLPAGLAGGIAGCLVIASAIVVDECIKLQSKSAKKELNNLCRLNLNYKLIPGRDSILNESNAVIRKKFMEWLISNELHLFVPSVQNINEGNLKKYEFIALIQQANDEAVHGEKNDNESDDDNDSVDERDYDSVSSGSDDDSDDEIDPVLGSTKSVLANNESPNLVFVNLNERIRVKIAKRSINSHSDIIVYDYFDFADFKQTPKTNKINNDIGSYAKCMERIMGRIFGNKKSDLKLNYKFIESHIATTP
jgi:hypothetical protein